MGLRGLHALLDWDEAPPIPLAGVLVGNRVKFDRGGCGQSGLSLEDPHNRTEQAVQPHGATGATGFTPSARGLPERGR